MPCRWLVHHEDHEGCTKDTKGPSHCLPTNTTARFASGMSVYEFLKRSSIVRYDAAGLFADAGAIVALATAEGLDAHAASVQARITKG